MDWLEKKQFSKRCCTAVTAAIKKDQCLTIQELATMLDMAFATVQSTFSVDLGLVMKSACWVPKLLKKRGECSTVRTSFSSLSCSCWLSWAILLPWMSLPCPSTDEQSGSLSRGLRNASQALLRPKCNLHEWSKWSLSSSTPRVFSVGDIIFLLN